MPERFWSDDFDMDLLKLFPDLPERLGLAADIPMWTHAHTSYGRLNHPAVWGGEAFFGLSPGGAGEPEWCSTDKVLVECTWLEALRDAWPHTYRLIVGGRWVVWDTAAMIPTFFKIMYDLRGIHKLPAGQADRLKGHVLASVLAATRDLNSIVTAVGVDG